jgi:hypothetical protein
MIDQSIATFRIRSFGVFELSAAGLKYLRQAEPTDFQELAEEVASYAFDSLDSAHITVEEMVNHMPEAFAVHPSALMDVQINFKPLPPVPEGSIA